MNNNPAVQHHTQYQPPIRPTLILPGEGCRARLTLLNPHNVEVVGEVRVEEEWRAIRSYCIPRHIWEAAGRLFSAEPTLILQEDDGEAS